MSEARREPDRVVARPPAAAGPAAPMRELGKAAALAEGVPVRKKKARGSTACRRLRHRALSRDRRLLRQVGDFLGEGCRTRGHYRVFSSTITAAPRSSGRDRSISTRICTCLARPHQHAAVLPGQRPARRTRRLILPIVGTSSAVAANWRGDLGLVFIDGGHAKATVEDDFRGWSRFVTRAAGCAFTTSIRIRRTAARRRWKYSKRRAPVRRGDSTGWSEASAC